MTVTVAHGRVHPTNEGATVHNLPIRADMARVQVDDVVEQWAELQVPCPPEPDATKLGQCKLGFIQWPKAEIVIEGQSSARTSPTANPSPPSRASPVLGMDEDRGMEPQDQVQSSPAYEKRSKRGRDPLMQQGKNALSPATLHGAVDAAMAAGTTPKEAIPLEESKPAPKRRNNKRGGTSKKNASEDSAAKALSFGSGQLTPSAKHYIKGEPLVHQYQLDRMGLEEKTLHNIYMVQSKDPSSFVSYFSVNIKQDLGYHFYRAWDLDKFDVNFDELWGLYNLDRLDSGIMRLWTLMQSKESKRVNSPFAFLDPALLSELQIRSGAGELAIQYIAEAWHAQRHKEYIVMAYNPT